MASKTKSRIKNIFSRRKVFKKRSFLICQKSKGFLGKKKRAILDGECLLCGACVGICPQDNLTIIGEKLEIGEGCVGCGSCEKICPVEAISLEKI